MKRLSRLALAAAATLAAASVIAQTNPSTTIDVKAELKGTCQIVQAAEINFNLLDPASTSDMPATGSIRFWCTRGVPYTLVLDMGQNATGGKRRMKGVTGTNNFIPYELNNTSLTGTGAGPTIQFTVSLPATVRAADYRNAAVGAYKDTLTVTVQN